jgi:hypothetical protein
MGFATNALFFFLVLGTFLTYTNLGTGTKTTALDAFYGAYSREGGKLPSDFNFVDQIINSGVLGVSLAVIGSVIFPNPYVIFGLFVAGILSSWMFIPYQLFNWLPGPIGYLFTAAFGFVISMGVLNWYKGGTGEL